MPLGYTGIGKITEAGNFRGYLMFHGIKHPGNMERNVTCIIRNSTENPLKLHETYHESLPETYIAHAHMHPLHDSQLD